MGLMSPMDFTFQSLPYLGYLWRVPTYKLSSPYVGFTRCSFIERYDNLQSDVGFYKQSYDIDVLPLNWRYFVPVSQAFSLFLQSLISLFSQKKTEVAYVQWCKLCMNLFHQYINTQSQYTLENSGALTISNSITGIGTKKLQCQLHNWHCGVCGYIWFFKAHTHQNLKVKSDICNISLRKIKLGCFKTNHSVLFICLIGVASNSKGHDTLTAKSLIARFMGPYGANMLAPWPTCWPHEPYHLCCLDLYRLHYCQMHCKPSEHRLPIDEYRWVSPDNSIAGGGVKNLKFVSSPHASGNKTYVIRWCVLSKPWH